VLVSQGVNQHIQTPTTTRPPSPSESRPSSSAPKPRDCEWHERPELLPNDMFISSRDDLSLEDVEDFLSYFLRTSPSPAVAAAKAAAAKDPNRVPSPLFRRKVRSNSNRTLDLSQADAAQEDAAA
jgi:hypothetical protein